MPSIFTPADVEQLRRQAKAQRSGTALTQTQALDQIAKEQGWPNWALLQKNAQPAALEDALQLSIEQYRGGDRGVFVLQLRLNDQKLRAVLERGGELSFELPPVPPRWIVRRFTELRGSAPDPFLDRRWDAPRGRFVEGRFLCIVSTNGVQDNEVEAEIASRLSLLGASFREQAIVALTEGTDGRHVGHLVRLFYSQPKPGGGDEILELTFGTLDEARQAELPPGARAIGVPTPQGWWTYQRQFGWQPPAR